LLLRHQQQSIITSCSLGFSTTSSHTLSAKFALRAMIPSCWVSDEGPVQLVDQVRHHLTTDKLELCLRDLLRHNHSVIAKHSNAVANTQYLDEFL
jgi:hypothetical protein